MCEVWKAKCTPPDKCSGPGNIKTVSCIYKGPVINYREGGVLNARLDHSDQDTIHRSEVLGVGVQY